MFRNELVRTEVASMSDEELADARLVMDAQIMESREYLMALNREYDRRDIAAHIAEQERVRRQEATTKVVTAQ